MRKLALMMIIMLFLGGCKIEFRNLTTNPSDIGNNDQIAIVKKGWVDLSGKPIIIGNEPMFSPIGFKENKLGPSWHSNIDFVLDNNNNPCVVWFEKDGENKSSIFFVRWEGDQWIDAYGNIFCGKPLASSTRIINISNDLSMTVNSENDVFISWISTELKTTYNTNLNANMYEETKYFVNLVKISNNAIYAVDKNNKNAVFDGINCILFSSDYPTIKDEKYWVSPVREFGLVHLASEGKDVILTWQGIKGVYSEVYYFAKLTEVGWVNYYGQIPTITADYCSNVIKEQPDGNVFYANSGLMAFAGQFTGGKVSFCQAGVIDNGKINKFEYQNRGDLWNVSIAKGSSRDCYFLVAPVVPDNKMGYESITHIYQYVNGVYNLILSENTDFEYNSTKKVVVAPDGSLYYFKEGGLLKWNSKTRKFENGSEPFLDLSSLASIDLLDNVNTKIEFDKNGNIHVGYLSKKDDRFIFNIAKWSEESKNEIIKSEDWVKIVSPSSNNKFCLGTKAVIRYQINLKNMINLIKPPTCKLEITDENGKIVKKKDDVFISIGLHDVKLELDINSVGFMQINVYLSNLDGRPSQQDSVRVEVINEPVLNPVEWIDNKPIGTRRPLVLVNGIALSFINLMVASYNVWNENPSEKQWDNILLHFKKKGVFERFKPYIFLYDSNDTDKTLPPSDCVGVENVADKLAKCLENASIQTDIHFIAHSMGGLVCRNYLANNNSKVDRIITLFTPHRGSFLPNYPPTQLALSSKNGTRSKFLNDISWDFDYFSYDKNMLKLIEYGSKYYNDILSLISQVGGVKSYYIDILKGDWSNRYPNGNTMLSKLNNNKQNNWKIIPYCGYNPDLDIPIRLVRQAVNEVVIKPHWAKIIIFLKLWGLLSGDKDSASLGEIFYNDGVVPAPSAIGDKLDFQSPRLHRELDHIGWANDGFENENFFESLTKDLTVKLFPQK